MNAEKTGRLIHDLRTKKGMTQQGLAELLRIIKTEKTNKSIRHIVHQTIEFHYIKCYTV